MPLRVLALHLIRRAAWRWAWDVAMRASSASSRFVSTSVTPHAARVRIGLASCLFSLKVGMLIRTIADWKQFGLALQKQPKYRRTRYLPLRQ